MNKACIFARANVVTITLGAVATALALQAGAVSAAEAVTLPIVKQPLSLSYWVPMNPQAPAVIKSYAEMDAYKLLAERTGVSVSFTHPPQGAELERLNLMVASGKYPDVIEYDWFRYPGGPGKALADKAIVPLNDLIKKYAPNLQAILDKYPEVRRQVSTEDGTIYVFPLLRLDPVVRTFWGPQIRADWLAKLGLKAPTTIGEWHTVLTAFKTRNPNGEGNVIPYSTNQVDGNEKSAPGLPYGLWPFMSAYGLAPEFYQVGGKVRYSPAEPAYKDFLATMQQWYREGLIDPDYVSQRETALDAKVLKNEVGAWAGYNGAQLGRFTNLAKGKIAGFQVAGVPFPAGANGKRYTTWPTASQIFSGYGAAISSRDRHVVETVKFLDYGYSKEGGLALNFGREGVSYTMVNGVPRFTDSVLKNPKLSIAEAILRNARPQGGPFVQDPNYFLQFYPLKEQTEALHTWATASTDLLLPPITVNPADARAFNAKMAEISTYVAEMTTKFITGRAPMSEFDAYRATLDKLGMRDAIAMMQTALDRYNTKK
ncbi:bacterial extracellular solute-binding family protein (plasmid) [Burkholderia pseudomallei]|uniref:extracellular solute-binding protein n=1 Tax=Burkholderia pseudomallei TaxID=28450 RepID=UPI00052ABCA9|nr:extracellular solute-binding protein [Burkholderia pseudomallei]AIV73737.1 bacterial extracellular solute-binding family protein [Burkholderia pseudomallei]